MSICKQNRSFWGTARLRSASLALIMAFSALPTAAFWPLQGGDGGDTSVDEVPVVMTPAGEVLMAGEFSGETTIADATLISRGGTDIWVAKFDGLGEPVWVTSAGGPDNDEVWDLDIDAQGRTFLAGTFGGGIMRFGSFELDGGSNSLNGFVASLSDIGTWRWARQIGSTAASARISRIELTIARGEPTLDPTDSPEPQLFVAGTLAPYCYISYFLDEHKECHDGNLLFYGLDGPEFSPVHDTPGESCGLLDGCTGNSDELDPDTRDPNYRWLARMTATGEWNWIETPTALALGRTLDLSASEDGTVYASVSRWGAENGHEPNLFDLDRRIERFTPADQEMADPAPSWIHEVEDLNFIALAEGDPNQLYTSTLYEAFQLITDGGTNPTWPAAARIEAAHVSRRVRAVGFENGSHALLVSGYYTGTARFLDAAGTQSVQLDSTETSAFIARLDSDGTWAWARGPVTSVESRGRDVSAQGSLGVVAGTFNGELIFGDQGLDLEGDPWGQFAVAFSTSSGDWLVPAKVTVTEPLAPPPGVLDPDGEPYGIPTLSLSGDTGMPGISHLWNEATNRLHILRPGVAEISWPAGPPQNPGEPVTTIAFVDWPEEDCPADLPPPGPCVQRHVAGAPVEVTPNDPPAGEELTFVRVSLPGFESSGAVVENGILNAPRSGWSVLTYTEHPSTADPTSLPVRFQIVRSEDRTAETVSLAQQPLDCTIGRKIEHAWHNQDLAPDPKTGYVLNPQAFYDGLGADRAYDRQTRRGAIIAVNRFSEDRAVDGAMARQMDIAWYRQNSNHVYWPSRAARYDCRWPELGDAQSAADQQAFLRGEKAFRIVIASLQGTGAEGQPELDPALLPSIQLYDQPNVLEPGYNPNDEHALFTSPNGTGNANAVFALRSDFGAPINEEVAASDPYVLLKYYFADSDTSDGTDDSEWRFLVYKVEAEDASKGFRFEAAGEAGDAITQPYPLVRLDACPEHTVLLGERPLDLEPPKPFFRDHKGGLWARTQGDGAARFFYPLASDFFLDEDNDDIRDEPAGTCVPWLGRWNQGVHATPDPNTPIDYAYRFTWPAQVPLLTVGETLLEPKSGLPNIKDQPAVTVIYDQLQDETLLDGIFEPTKSLVRLIEPLERRAVPLGAVPGTVAKAQSPDGRFEILGSADGSQRVPPSLGRRLRFDPQLAFCLDQPPPSAGEPCQESATGGLTFDGLLEDPGIGEDMLLINVMTDRERRLLIELSGEDPAALASRPTLDCGADCTWGEGVETLYRLSRNPQGVDIGGCTVSIDTISSPLGDLEQTNISCTPPMGGPDPELLIGLQNSSIPGRPLRLSKLGPGGALTAGFAQGTGYVTLVFGNDPSLGAAPVSVEVIRVGCFETAPPDVQLSTYQGQLHVITPENVFDEQITLRHSGDFAGRSDDLQFRWYAQPDVDGTSPTPLPGEPGSAWQEITDTCSADPDPNGAIECTIGGANIRTLEDTWYLTQYKGLPACGNQDSFSFLAGGPGGTAAQQVAQLGEGWVKRVIRQINPFEQRIKDFRRTEVDTTANMLSLLGQRFEGSVPLSNDPEILNGLGLIEIYETVMNRAMALSVNATPPLSTPAGNRAILLVATRLAEFYSLLGNEAWADAVDPTLGLTTDSGLGAVAPSLFNFQNQFASLLEEELVLLRGRDDSQAVTTAPPVYNRALWNFTLGEGQIAYQTSYAINDQNADGTIDVHDAIELFPQGHGDAWGHYSTALQKHYRLLRHPTYLWHPRTEAVLIAGAPMQVDFLDERKFARAAASRARVGAEIVDLTYRQEYVEDVAGQWQGYKDTDTDRAWGVSGWARRAGMGAYFDWLAGNHMLPAEDPNPDHQGIQKIDRQTVDELDQIVAFYREIQGQLDEADRGLNPLGLAKGVVPFDLDPSRVDQGETHFEQVHERAMVALDNAVTVWNFANLLSQQLRRNQDSAEDLAHGARDGEADFLSRLKEVFGTPYPDDIGAGKTYPNGYEGPDIYHYQLIDLASIAGQRLDQAQLGGELRTFDASYSPMPGGLGFFPKLGDNPGCETPPFAEGCSLGQTPNDLLNVQYVEWDSPEFGQALVKPPDWVGVRRITGTLQTSQQEIHRAQLALRQGIREYDNLRREAEAVIGDLRDFFDIRQQQLRLANLERDQVIEISNEIVTLNNWSLGLRRAAEFTRQVAGMATSECLPKSIGFSTDALSPARCGILLATTSIANLALDSVADGLEGSMAGLEVTLQDVSLQAAIQTQVLDTQLELSGFVGEFEALMRQEPILRAELLQLAQNLQQAQEAYRNELAYGLSLLEDLTGFRKTTAAAVQEHRLTDMAFRLFRNDALQKYRASFDLAARFTYLAATAYDYDTNLVGSDGAAGRAFLTDIVKERSLGQVLDGEPLPGSSGLADPIGRMRVNFDVLKGQMGFNNPQIETTRFSLRREHLRVREEEDPDWQNTWRTELQARYVPDLWQIEDFRRLARPLAPESFGPQPAVVIPFDSTVTFGLNFFGEQLDAGDSSYNPSNFATRIRSVGIWLDGYNLLPLSATPQAYLLPVGADVLRAPSANDFSVREWRVVDQVLPVPFPIGNADVQDPAWVPTADTLSGSFGESRRFSSFRAFPYSENLASNELTADSRLVGRSVWNRRWLLILPGGTLLEDGTAGLECLIGRDLDNDGQIPLAGGEPCPGIDDIKLFFQTYAYSGN